MGVRKTKDLLVFINQSFRFYNPAENHNILFFKVNDYLVPICPGKALYGYHVGKSDCSESQQVILGVNQEGIVSNHITNNILVKIDNKQQIVEEGNFFKPQNGMEVLVDNICIQIINKSE